MSTRAANYYVMNKPDRSGHVIVDGDFTQASATSMERPIYPFPADTTNFLLEQDFEQYVEYYAESVPEVGQTHPQYPDMYFCYDTPLRDKGAGVVSFTRVWSLLPGFNGEPLTGSYTRREAESFTWEVPGRSTVDSVWVTWFIDNATSIATDDGTNITLYTIQNPITATRWEHDVGNSVTATIWYYIYDSTTKYWKPYSYTTPIVASGTNYITVANVPYDDTSTSTPIIYYAFAKPRYQINPKQRTIASVLFYDYYVPGINCDSPETIPIVKKWTVEDEHGNETNILTEASNPTITEYQALVAANTFVPLEDSTYRRWKGNIWERTTRYGYLV